MKVRDENLEFYKDLCSFEYNRSDFYDKVVQYPTTLLVIFVGGVLYSFNNFFACGLPNALSCYQWVFVSIVGLFVIITLATIWYLFSVFHGFARRYEHLPFADELAKQENKLFLYYFRYSEKNRRKKRIRDADKKTDFNCRQTLKDYYVKIANKNQKMNDERADNYFIARTLIFVDLFLFVVIGLMGFIKI